MGVIRTLRDLAAYRRYRSGTGPATARVGRLGEELAANLLRDRGMRIVARNENVAGVEVDLIVGDGGDLVFVEVKSRTDREFGTALEGVTAAQQRRLRRAGEIYLQRQRLGGVPLRFDVVTVEFPGEPGNVPPRIEVIRDAF